MNSSRASSTSESESMHDNDLSCEDSGEESSRPQYHQYYTNPQNPSVRYVIADATSSAHESVNLPPSYSQQRGGSGMMPLIMPTATSRPQPHIDNNSIYRTFSYYSQQHMPYYPQPANNPQYPPIKQSFDYSPYPPTKNPELVSVRYIAPIQQVNSFISKRMESTYNNQRSSLSLSNHAVQYLPNGGHPNYPDRRIFFVDSYGMNQNLNYYPPYYNQSNNPAFDMGSQKMLNYNQMQSQSPIQQQQQTQSIDQKKTQSSTEHLHPQQQSHTQIFNKPVSSQWNIAGGFSNSYGTNQKFYKELVDNSNPKIDPFFQENSPLKDKNNFLEYENYSPRRCRIIVISVVAVIAVIALVLVAVLGTILPKKYAQASLSSNISRSLVESNLTSPNLTQMNNTTLLNRQNLSQVIMNSTIATIINQPNNEINTFTRPISLLNILGALGLTGDKTNENDSKSVSQFNSTSGTNATLPTQNVTSIDNTTNVVPTTSSANLTNTTAVPLATTLASNINSTSIDTANATTIVSSTVLLLDAVTVPTKEMLVSTNQSTTLAVTTLPSQSAETTTTAANSNILKQISSLIF